MIPSVILRASINILIACKSDVPLNMSQISKKSCLSYSHVVKMILSNPDVFICQKDGRTMKVSLSNKGINAADLAIGIIEALK